MLTFYVSNAQTTTLPAKTVTISNDTTITLTPGGGTNLNYHICPQADVIFTGISTYLMRFYLESNSSVELDDTMNFFVVADVFMKENSAFDFNHKAGSMLDTVMIDLPCNLIDTGTSVTNLVLAPNLVFDYSLLPNGLNPCAAPTGIRDINNNSSAIIQNPVYDNILINSSAFKSNTQLLIYNYAGQLIIKQQLHNTQESISAASMPPGLYTYVIYSEKRAVQRGKLQKW